MGADFKVALVIRAIDQATAPLRSITRNFESFRTGVAKARDSFDIAAKMQLASGAVGSFAAKSRSFLESPIHTGTEFEFAMSKVQAKADASKEDLAQLTTEAQRLGSTTLFSATQAAEGMEELAAQGFSTTQILSSTSAIMDLATAASVDFKRATEITTEVLHGFQIDAEKTQTVTDMLAWAANASGASVEDLGESLSFTAAQAHALGISLPKTVSMLSVLADAGIKGSRGGTGLNSVLQGLAAARRNGGKELQALGIQTADEHGNLRDPTELLSALSVRTKSMGTAERTGVMTKLFGIEGSPAATILLDALDKLKRRESEAGRDATGSAAKTAAVTSDNLAGAERRLNGALENFHIAVYTQLGPALTYAVTTFTSFVRALGAFASEHTFLTKALVFTAAAVAIVATGITGLLVVGSSLVTMLGVWAVATGSSKTGVELLGGALKNLAPRLRAIAAADVGAGFGRLFGWVRSLWTAITANLLPALGRMVTTITTRVVSSLAAFAASAARVAVTIATRVWSAVTLLAGALWDLSVPVLTRLFPTFISFGQAIGRFAVTVVTRAIPAALTFTGAMFRLGWALLTMAARAVASFTLSIVQMSWALVVRAVTSIGYFVASVALAGASLLWTAGTAIASFIGSLLVLSTMLIVRGVMSLGAFIASIVATAVSMIATLIPALIGATASFVAFGIAVLATPVGWIAALVALLVTGAILIWRNWDTVKQFFVDLWDWMKEHTAWMGIFAPLLIVPLLLAKAWQPLKSFFSSLWSGIKTVFTTTIDFLSAKLEPLLEGLHWAEAKLGLGPDTPATQPGGPAVQALGPAVQTLTDARAAASQGATGDKQPVNVGGELRIVLDDQRARVAGLRADGPMDLSIDTGMTMAGAR